MSPSAPCIRPLTEALRGVPALPRDGVQLFLVVSEGTFSGRTFAGAFAGVLVWVVFGF